MSRILFISHSAGRTGAPLMLLNALRWIRDNSELSFDILLKEDGELRTEFEDLAPTRVLAGPPHKLSWLKPWQLLRVKKNQVDPLELPSLKEHYEARGITVVYANTITLGDILEKLQGLGAKVITHVHELSHWIDLCGEKNLAQVKFCSNHYVAASMAVKKNLVDNYGFPKADIDVVLSFLDLSNSAFNLSLDESLKQKLGIENHEHVVVASGYETWRKGKDLFVDLAIILNAEMPNLNWKFMWVGGWESAKDKEAILSKVEEAGLVKQFLFVGEVSRPLSYFKLGDVFALLSREEPLGLVGLEASMLGLPLVCFDGAGGMPEFIEGDAGICVPYMDIEAMALAIQKLNEDPQLATKMNRRAVQKISERYDVSIGASAIVNIIKKIESSESVQQL